MEAKLLTSLSRKRDALTGLDPQVLRRAQAGEEEACRALYRHYHPRVFAFLVRMLGGRPADAEDLLQETFIRVFRALPRFKPDDRATLSTWILTIAYRLSLNTLRRRRPEFVSASELDLIAPGGIDHELNQKVVSRVLVETVLRLAPDFRVVFLLSDYHDLTYNEISTVVGVSVGTVKSRLYRARQQVRKALETVSDA